MRDTGSGERVPALGVGSDAWGPNLLMKGKVVCKQTSAKAAMNVSRKALGMMLRS